MLTEITFYKVIITVTLVIWLTYLAFSILYAKLKKFRFPLFILLSIGSLIVTFFFTNTVYIINDDDQIQKMVLVIPYKYELSNNQYTIIWPSPGLSKIWLINDGHKPAWFELVTYGDTFKLPLERQALTAFSAIKIDNIEYFFEAPPKSIKTINPPVSRGWLHR